jgi:hypothetical protein
MALLSYDRYCDEIVAQTGLLSSCVKGADPALPVPSCPGWDAGRLLRHLGDVQRWAEATVRTRASRPLPVEHSRDLPTDAGDDTAVLGPWLAQGAARLAGALRDAGPMHLDIHPWTRELLGPGRTLHFHATDTPPEAAAEWLIDLTGDAVTWRRAHEKAAVAVRAPLTDLLMVIYKRRLPRGDGIDVFGDTALLDFWLERVSFG